eukprot:14829020-Alexandrium_andersonii.AAC.1
MAAAPAQSSAVAEPDPSKVTIRPGEDAEPSRTAWPTQGLSDSPARTGWVAASSATHSPHRHRLTRRAAFA